MSNTPETFEPAPVGSDAAPAEPAAPAPLQGFHPVRNLEEGEAFAVQGREFLDAEHAQMISQIGQDLHAHGALEGNGVDLSALKQADPTFNDETFTDIARECFNLIREARSIDNPATAAGTLSPELAAQLQSSIDRDVASHRHHLLPGLTVKTAQIVSSAVTGGKLTVGVQFHLSSQEMDRDADLNLIGGSAQWQEWDEHWTFWRDPSVDTSAADEDHILSRQRDGGWLFAHQGWIVTQIERLGAPDPLAPSNL